MAAMSKEAALPTWGFAVAGSAGAILANTLVYPLDIVKTRLQVQVKRKPGLEPPIDAADHEHYTDTFDAINKIVKKDGISGLYAGLPGTLIGVGSTNFAYFYWYTIVRAVYETRVAPPPHSTAVELSLGAISGALAQLFTIPVAVCTTRQQTVAKSERKSLIATGKEVIAEDGVSGLWRGLKASLVLVVNPAITYGAYQRLREIFFHGKKNLTPLEAFVLGAASKALATIFTQPLIVAKVGLQSRPPPGVPKFQSFWEVMRYIVQHEGLLSLFKGITPQLMKGLLVQGFLMMTKERMELMFILLWRYLLKVRSERAARLLSKA